MSIAVAVALLAGPATAQAAEVTLPTRGCFVYEWYPETWTVGGVHVAYHPVLGYYTSDDQNVINKHVQWLRIGKCKVNPVSWWGRGHHKENTRLPALLNRAQAVGGYVNFTAYYEPEGQGNPSVETIRSDLAYLRAYASHPQWAHVNGKPVIFVWADGDSACEVASRWKKAAPDWYVQMKLSSGFRTCADQPDSWHQYGPATAYHHHAGYYTNASPGFCKANESTCRLPRDLLRFRQNVRDSVAANEPWQLYTSFNEWGEGTAMEAAQEWATPSCPLCQGWYIDALAKNGVYAGT